MLTAFFMILFGMMANGCGGGGGGGGIAAPGVPTNFVVVGNQGGQDLSATLTWDVPASGGEVVSYEIYRSTTAGTVFNPDNHLISIPAVEGQVSYAYIDNAGLEKNVPTYWVVAAKNAGGETPTSEKMWEFTTGEVTSYGNNFAAAMIFADGYGITGQAITGTWTKETLNPGTDIDYNTGLRPSIDQVTLTELPYWDASTTFVKDGVTYYKQQTVSSWQGEWNSTSYPDTQHVTATWGDNLISQTLTSESKIRIEVVLTKDLDTNMTSYKMVSLYGSKYNEIYGTDKSEYNNTKAFVFATNAHLKIQKVDEVGNPLEDPLYDQTLFTGDGPGHFASEINVAGNHTYGFVWDLANDSPGYEKTGIWRITFSLDGESPAPISTPNNTYIDNVAPTEAESGGTLPVYVSPTEVYIDITIHP